MKWNIVLGAPGELFRALEDNVEDSLGYRIDRSREAIKQQNYLLPSLKATGIPNVAEFFGTFKGDIAFWKRKWGFLIAGIILVLAALFVFFLAFQNQPISLTQIVLTLTQTIANILVGIALLVVGIILIAKSSVSSAVSLRVILEGEAYQARVSSDQEEKNAYSERFSVLSRARLTLRAVYEKDEPPKEVVEKATQDLNALIKKVEEVLPKFEIPKIELPESKP